VNYWQRSFPHLTGNKSIGSVLTRLDTLLSRSPSVTWYPSLRTGWTLPKSWITAKYFWHDYQKERWAVRPPICSEPFWLPSSSKSRRVARAQAIDERRHFWLYIDEFANFITPSMADILSGARKYRIGLTLAHHDLHQLQRNSEVASAVMSHPFTRVVFKGQRRRCQEIGPTAFPILKRAICGTWKRPGHLPG